VLVFKVMYKMIFVDISAFSNVLVKNFSNCFTVYFAVICWYLTTFMANKVDQGFTRKPSELLGRWLVVAVFTDVLPTSSEN